MNLHSTFKASATATVLLALAACGGPSQEPPATPPPSQPQEQSRADAPVDDDALRAPSRPEAETRQPRDLDADTASATPEAAGAQAATTGAGFAEGHPVPDEVRPLLGEWVVTGHRFGAVSAMDDASASQLHGREVSFGESHANSGADSCGAPRYTAEERNVVESLLAEYRTTPIQLGLDEATDARVTIIDIECAAAWVTLGSRVLVLPGGLLLAPWDGVFFELQPR